MENRIDHWYEEDEEVFVHPRDPYHRVDVLESSRHVRISVNGEVVAETDRPMILFETGLPPRYYITPEDVRDDVLLRSEKTSQCPYKERCRFLLLGRGWWGASRGSRLVLPGADRCGREDQGPPLLLQREGRPRSRRRGAGAPPDAVVLTPTRPASVRA